MNNGHNFPKIYVENKTKNPDYAVIVYSTNEGMMTFADTSCDNEKECFDPIADKIENFFEKYELATPDQIKSVWLYLTNQRDILNKKINSLEIFADLQS